MSKTIDASRKLMLLKAFGKIDKPRVKDLAKATNIPEVSIKRQIVSLCKDFDMRIKFMRDGDKGSYADGYYKVTDWGVFNEAAFKPKK